MDSAQATHEGTPIVTPQQARIASLFCLAAGAVAFPWCPPAPAVGLILYGLCGALFGGIAMKGLLRGALRGPGERYVGAAAVVVGSSWLYATIASAGS